MAPSLDPLRRQISHQLLIYSATQLVHAQHQLYRISHNFADGLTDGEKKYLDSCVLDLKTVLAKVQQVAERTDPDYKIKLKVRNRARK